MAVLERAALLLCLVVMATDACSKGKKPPNPEPTEKFPRMAQLDSEGDYFLYWKANSTHAVFEVHVRTRGWVGFGLSKNGGMTPADVMIGWVKDGYTTVTDRYADAYYEPRLDESQDWIKLLGMENDFGTVLKFARKLDSCDEKDFNIEGGTTKVIYAFHPEDPVMRTGLCYHGSTRGTKDLYLLDTRPINKQLPPDTRTVDFLNDNALVPSQHTYYHCVTHRLPELQEKHHLVAFEPVIENVDIVHHIVLYVCDGDPGPRLAGLQYQCYQDVPEEIRKNFSCVSTVYAWAVGGDTLYLPEYVGLPVADGYLPNFFVLETHYNNPRLMQGRRDSSGLRLHYTRTLRPNDGSLLMVGQAVTPISMIPPYFPDFAQISHCPSNCTRKAFQQVANQEIKIVGALLHSHLLGRKMILRHFREGRELPPIAKDLTYDFDFQEFRLLNQDVVVKAGDVLTMECHYDSTGRSTITQAGLGTEEEMCLAFLFYYPRSSLFGCSSMAKAWESYNLTLGQDVYFKYRERLMSQGWMQEATRNAFQDVMNAADHFYVCVERRPEMNYKEELVQMNGPPAAVMEPYSPPPRPTCADK